MAYNPSNIYKTIVKRPVGEENKLYINLGLQFFDTDTSSNIEVDNDITAELYDESDALIDTFTAIITPQLVYNEATEVYEYLNYDVTNYAGQTLTLKVNYSVSGVPQSEFVIEYQTSEISSAVFLVGENLTKHDSYLYLNGSKTVLLHLLNNENKKVDALNNECKFTLYDTETATTVLTENCTRQNVGIYTATFTVPGTLELGTLERYQGYFEVNTSTGYEEVSGTREYFLVAADPKYIAANYGPALCTSQDVRNVYPAIDALLSEYRNLGLEQREIYLQNKISYVSRYIRLETKNYRQFESDLIKDYCAMKVCQDVINMSGSRMKTDDNFLMILNREVLRIENIFHTNDSGIIPRG